MTTSSPRPFSQSWTLNDTRYLLDLPEFPKGGTWAEQEAWRKTVGGPADQKLAIAIGEHMAWVLNKGTQVFPGHCRGLNTPFLHALELLVQSPDDKEAQAQVGAPFVRHMSTHVILNPSRPESADDIHAKLLALVENGNFNAVLGHHQTCFETGIRLNFNFDGWKATAGTRRMVDDPDRSWGRMVFEPLDPSSIKFPTTHEVRIPVPSGRLLIADWFRVKGFDALTRPLDAGPEDEIQSVVGRSNITQRYAQTLGVGHVFCQSPDIVSSMGAITAGKLHCNAENGEDRIPAGHAGSIRADLRWTTFVDREHLIRILGDQIGEDEARQEVEQMERDHPEIIKLDVEPGWHHLYFSGKDTAFQETIAKSFASEGLFLEEDYEIPGFALTQDALPRLTPKPSPGPRASR